MQFEKLSNFIKVTFSTLIFLIPLSSYADQDLLSLFPLKNYDQNVSSWLNTKDPNYNKSLLRNDIQQKRLNIFYDHYFGSSSPWSIEYVNRIIHLSSDIKSIENSFINDFSNDGKSESQLGYGENFHPYDKSWIENISNNMNISQFDGLIYHTNHRGIAIDNLHARILPTEDVHFYHYKMAGQGYPFDNLQMSALWAGTPVYILGETRDHAWMLVITPDFIAWVKSNGIACVDNNFIDVWMAAAKNKLVAITHTQTSIVDESGKFLFLAYIGSVFPGNSDATDIKIMVPTLGANGQASIKHASISRANVMLMPAPATPYHFSEIMSSMIGRPYGWGSVYFYNDCSAELKSLLTPFGIWLPRHSSDQVTVGKIVDMTSFSPEQRLAYLIENGKRFITLIYTGGHIIMYIGNYPDLYKSNSLMAMTYQNMWGLSPNPPIRRAVIGKAVLFPMLLQYPEDLSLTSLAAKKFFQVSYLDELPDMNEHMKRKTIELRSLMYPEK